MPRAGPPRAVTFARSADLSGLEWLRAHDLGSFARHVHDTFSIGLVDRGANVYRCGPTKLVAPVGAVCVVNPDEVHTGGEGGEGWSYWNVYPSRAQMQRAAESALGRPGPLPEFRPVVIADPLAAAKLRALFASLAEPATRLERESRLLEALASLVLRHAEHGVTAPPPRREPAAVRRAHDYLHDRVTENVSLDELARIAGLSEFHLARVFRATYGIPPHAYQLSLRLRMARALLAAGSPIAGVAATCGFSDQAHFTRKFKAAYGATPGQVLAPCDLHR